MARRALPRLLGSCSCSLIMACLSLIVPAWGQEAAVSVPAPPSPESAADPRVPSSRSDSSASQAPSHQAPSHTELARRADPLATGLTLTDESSGTIAVVVENLRNGKGDVRIGLFSRADGFPDEINQAVDAVRAVITNHRASVAFQGVPFGNYAIGVHHDEDEDGEMDTNLLGIPTEGYGASNDVRGTFGPPDWEGASFTLRRPLYQVFVNIQY